VKKNFVQNEGYIRKDLRSYCGEARKNASPMRFCGKKA